MLNHAVGKHGEYYELPGGGQSQYETLEEAVVRECLEETGYTVCVERLAAVHEEICDIRSVRKKRPNHSHRVFFLFRCHITDAQRIRPRAADKHQIGVEWVETERLTDIVLRPNVFRPVIMELITAQHLIHYPPNRIKSIIKIKE